MLTMLCCPRALPAADAPAAVRPDLYFAFVRQSIGTVAARSLTGQLRAPIVHPANPRDGGTPECAALSEGVVCGAVCAGVQIIAGAVCGGIRRMIL